MKVYGDKISGNCLKVKYVCDLLDIPYSWIDVDVVAGEAKHPDMIAKNSSGQVPFIELDDGRILSQSNAIMRFLSEDSYLIPDDNYDRALMDQWLFWEQYSHETAIAVARFQVRFTGKAVSELDADLVKKGAAALELMERHLGENDWFVGSRLSLADIALFAYTQFAGEGGFSLSNKSSVMAWLKRVRESL